MDKKSQCCYFRILRIACRKPWLSVGDFLFVQGTCELIKGEVLYKRI